MFSFNNKEKIRPFEILTQRLTKTVGETNENG